MSCFTSILVLSPVCDITRTHMPAGMHTHSSSSLRASPLSTMWVDVSLEHAAACGSSVSPVCLSFAKGLLCPCTHAFSHRALLTNAVYAACAGRGAGHAGAARPSLGELARLQFLRFLAFLLILTAALPTLQIACGCCCFTCSCLPAAVVMHDDSLCAFPPTQSVTEV